MKVIFKQDVKGVGRKYEVKEISDGYANNFLIPKKLAEFATPDAVKKAEILKSTMMAEMEIREKLTEKQMGVLKETKVVLKRKANEKGHLFEKVHESEIALALKDQARIDIEAKFLTIEKPIKEAGEHVVLAEIGKNKAEFKVSIEV